MGTLLTIYLTASATLFLAVLIPYDEQPPEGVMLLWWALIWPWRLYKIAREHFAKAG